MTDASQTVSLFKNAAEAASAIGKGVDAAIGLAGSACNLWNDPKFETASAFVDTASKSAWRMRGAIAAAENLPVLARSMAGLLDMAGASVSMPALPERLASSAASGASSVTGARQSAFGGLVPGLSFVVGLFDLGVGVHNAVQIRRVGAQVQTLHDNISKRFQRVDESLAWQSHQIARLVAGQASMHARLEQLHHEINAGFDRVEAAVQGAEERRIADEYHQKVAVLTIRYRKVYETLAEGATVRASDLPRLLDAGEQLDAWAGAQLKRHRVGDPARLPYLVAQALAVRACADARAVEDGRSSVDRDVGRMVETISQEVFALCDGRDLHWIGVEVPEVITQYVYLARGLVMGQLFASRGTEGEFTPLGEPWDDGLGPLRAIARLPLTDEPGWMPLGALRDLEWFARWSGADPDATDLRGVRAVDLRSVAKALGLPGRPASPTRAQVETLLAIALATYREQVLARLMLAFGWAHAPRLIQRAADPAEVSKTGTTAQVDGAATISTHLSVTHNASRGVRSLEEVVARLEQVVQGCHHGYLRFAPAIPPYKLEIAERRTALPDRETTVVLVVCSTLSGNPSDAILLTLNGVWWNLSSVFKGPNIGSMPWANVNARIVGGCLAFNDDVVVPLTPGSETSRLLVRDVLVAMCAIMK
jgi:hypothetical protein